MKMSKIILNDLTKIFSSSVSAVFPENLIRNSLKYCPKSETLSVQGNEYELCGKNIYVVGTGKAVQNMAKETEKILNNKIKKGIISIPLNSYKKEMKNERLAYCEGAKNNLPDSDAEATAAKICQLAKSLTKDDILLVLISGGGSALLPLAKEPITLEEKTKLVKTLANSGADIQELNTVRKSISAVKGGKLALMAQPAQVISFVLSDIVGDPLDLIASGPTVQNKDTSNKAIEIIKKYKLYTSLPESIKNVLLDDEHSTWPEDNIKNFVIGSNKLSIEEAFIKARELNYTTFKMSNQVTGNVKDVACQYVKIAKVFCDFLSGGTDHKHVNQHLKLIDIPGLDTESTKIIDKDSKGVCLIFGGETTVHVKGKGLGGRNQQLALEFSNVIDKKKEDFTGFDIYILSAGTDGIDGPTDAAGAIGYKNLVSDAINQNINVQEYIDNNDSYNFYKCFKNGSNHVITGHTNTNVMDIQVILIMKSNN